MAKVILQRPILIYIYGVPGSGKTYLSKQLTNTFKVVHVSSDRIRNELFEKPRYDKEENSVVEHLALYMAEEFLKAGVSVVFDAHIHRTAQRRRLRDLARSTKAASLLIWLQIDKETALHRIITRDKRKTEHKQSRTFDSAGFHAFTTAMQNPKKDEDYVVLSGKHSYPMQRSVLMKRLYDLHLLNADDVPSQIIKPGLVNLIPGRVDMSRRNITIR